MGIGSFEFALSEEFRPILNQNDVHEQIYEIQGMFFMGQMLRQQLNCKLKDCGKVLPQALVFV